MMFFIAGEEKQNPIWRDDPKALFVFCYACGSGRTGTLPPWHKHLPSTWECFDCGAKWSNHYLPEGQR